MEMNSSLPIIFVGIFAFQTAGQEINTDIKDNIEHEVDDYSAMKIATDMHRLQADYSQAGCKSCTWKDIHYCKSQHVLEDHCCCDGWHKESFPYIPHVCYKHLQPLCQPVAADCDEYLRLNICCCQTILRTRWVSYTNGKSKSCPEVSTLLLFTAVIILACRILIAEDSNFP